MCDHRIPFDPFRSVNCKYGYSPSLNEGQREAWLLAGAGVSQSEAISRSWQNHFDSFINLLAIAVSVQTDISGKFHIMKLNL